MLVRSDTESVTRGDLNCGARRSPGPILRESQGTQVIARTSTRLTLASSGTVAGEVLCEKIPGLCPLALRELPVNLLAPVGGVTDPALG